MTRRKPGVAAAFVHGLVIHVLVGVVEVVGQQVELERPLDGGERHLDYDRVVPVFSLEAVGGFEETTRLSQL